MLLASGGIHKVSGAETPPNLGAPEPLGCTGGLTSSRVEITLLLRLTCRISVYAWEVAAWNPVRKSPKSPEPALPPLAPTPPRAEKPRPSRGSTRPVCVSAAPVPLEL